MYISGHQATFNPAVITNKEVHMVHGNINTNDETSHTTSNGEKISLKICANKMENLLPLYNFCYFFLNLFYNSYTGEN